MWRVDRIEPPCAVCEESKTGEWRNIPLVELPAGLREGDTLQKTSQGYRILREETARRRKELSAKIKNLFN